MDDSLFKIAKGAPLIVKLFIAAYFGAMIIGAYALAHFILKFW